MLWSLIIITVHSVQCTQQPHSISQHCRQELWCQFQHDFRLSRAKVGSINDDSGVPIMVHALCCTQIGQSIADKRFEQVIFGQYYNLI